MAAKAAGAPWSLKQIHKWMQDRNMTRLTFEEEQKLIAGEEPLPSPEPVQVVPEPEPEPSTGE